MRFGRRVRETPVDGHPPGIRPDQVADDAVAGEVPDERRDGKRPDAAPGLEDLPALLEDLRAAGHTVRFSDRLPDGAVPVEVSRAVQQVAICGISVIVRYLPPDQELHVRLRLDAGDLVASVQSHGLDGKDQHGLVPRSELAPMAGLLESLQARMTLRRTASGNWIAVIAVPLRGEAGTRSTGPGA